MTILFILVFSIPLASHHLSTILIHRFAAYILRSSCFILGSVIYGRLFQLTILFQSLSFFILSDFSFIEESNNLLTCFVPMMIYSNPDTDKSKILTDNKGRAAIYMWIYNETGKRYVGSAFNLSKRMYLYFSIKYLERNKSMYICNALFYYGYSAFTLTILEFINIKDLSLKEARKLILEREQYNLDFIFLDDEPNTYNILKVAGSSLGYKHTEESLTKMTGRINSAESKAKMSLAKAGEKHPMFGRTHSVNTKALISVIYLGKTLSASTKTLISEVLLDKTHFSGIKAKMSIAKETAIYVYDTQGTLVNTFSSARKAAEALGTNNHTIMKYAKNGNIFKDKWKLSTSEL